MDTHFGCVGGSIVQPTNRQERLIALLDRIHAGPILTSWHWLQWNFTPGTRGFDYFAGITVMALDDVDQKMPGYAEVMIERLEQLHGREKDQGHYNAIIEWLAELLVIKHLVVAPWPQDVRFEMEPVAGGSKKNPELVIEVPGLGRLGVEVKCPDLGKHQKLRSTQPWQLTARTDLSPSDLDGEVTLPRDNPVKDFLISADGKFAGFRDEDPDFRSVLFIIWDDYINEPLSALLAPSSGLLTPNSFHRDAGDRPVQYPNVDAVVVMRARHQLVLGTKNGHAVDQRSHFLDYGAREAFPPHALIPNPAGKKLQDVWFTAIGAWDIQDLVSAGAEYHPGEVVMWFDI